VRRAVTSVLVVGDEKNERFIEIIDAAQPNVLWVGMTAPKREKWVDKNRDPMKASISLHLESCSIFTSEHLRRFKKNENTGAVIWAADRCRDVQAQNQCTEIAQRCLRKRPIQRWSCREDEAERKEYRLVGFTHSLIVAQGVLRDLTG
jgi:hypothetical protein